MYEIRNGVVVRNFWDIPFWLKDKMEINKNPVISD